MKTEKLLIYYLCILVLFCDWFTSPVTGFLFLETLCWEDAIFHLQLLEHYAQGSRTF
jgi:hypothetical protein